MLSYSTPVPSIAVQYNNMQAADHTAYALGSESELYQGLTPEHSLLNFRDHIPSVILPHEDDTPSPPPHSPCPSQPVNEIDGRVRHIIQNDVTYGQRVDASGTQICRY